ncbi:hypothetical protein ACZ87_00940 [Candidatus Erwinia dacicola]|uniref:Uncharacterized protein n=1 Tax=Candidatus Erwinia dacicola TaxID=252393 RepID=A0A328TP64_9GAMM|nr:hypothetical protein ACZ87_00940 [Candidatus Erwinia dacicola]
MNTLHHDNGDRIAHLISGEFMVLTCSTIPRDFICAVRSVDPPC